MYRVVSSEFGLSLWLQHCCDFGFFFFSSRVQLTKPQISSALSLTLLLRVPEMSLGFMKSLFSCRLCCQWQF